MKKEENIILQSVRDFFGKHLVSVETNFFGRLANISIVYRDFVPMRDVYTWAADTIPYLWSISVEREYSEKAFASVPAKEGLEGDRLDMWREEWLLDKTIL